MVGELDHIAATLDYAPWTQAALRKIAEGIREAMDR